MKQISLIIVLVSSLLAVNSYAEETQRASLIASAGESTISASEGNVTVRVKIKTRKVQIGRPDDKRPFYVPSTCTYALTCNVVSDISIAVNGKKIFIPHSLVSDMAMLTAAEIRFEKQNIVLLIDEGDASESYFIKIEFDNKRVKSMNVYADKTMTSDQLLSETTYHLVVVK